MNNAVKHAHASRIRIEFDSTGRSFDLQISDNGNGMPEDARAGEGMGLHIMAYRAKAIGAKLEVAPGKDRGVTVRCLSTDNPSDDE